MPDSVLIIDDEPGITAALMVRLESVGFEVYHAINGLAGVEAVAMHRPDVVILDIRMPDIDGLEVCRRLRSNPDTADTPVVFLSANIPESITGMTDETGAAAFLAKPFEASDVIETVRSVLAGESARSKK